MQQRKRMEKRVCLKCNACGDCIWFWGQFGLYVFEGMQSKEHESEERVASACVSKMHEKSYILLLDKNIWENWSI
jgi:hypothetical protein